MRGKAAAVVREANARLVGAGDVEAIPEFFTPDYVAHVTGRDLTGGHAAIRKVMRMYRRAFPDLSVDVEILVQGKDRVAWQRTMRGTHRGPFRGFPPTGRPMVWREMLTSRLEAGRIAEEWLVGDLAERLLLATKAR